MKRRNYIDSITFRLSSRQRQALEELSMNEEKGLGEIAREMIDLGLKAKGIA
jgi:hypothetical protein